MTPDAESSKDIVLSLPSDELTLDRRMPSQKRVGIIVNTPAQVHFYRNIYRSLIEHGYRTVIIAREERETIDLLNEFDLPYSIFSTPPKSKLGKILAMPRDVIEASKLLKRNKVSLVTGFGVYDAYSSALLGISNIVFTDNEPKIGMQAYALEFRLFYPFIDSLITPSCFREDLGKKHIRIDGMKEFAYLHPNYYTPDDSIFEELGIERGERYFILRFNGLSALHDLGVRGFTPEMKIALVDELEKNGHVFISSEMDVPSKLANRVVRIPKNRIHDALYYASLLVTDTQTMATESAILGTPTVRCNTFVGPNDMGNFIELENKYHLMFNFRDFSGAMTKAVELAEDESVKAEWGLRRNRLFDETIDVTTFMVWLIENYPASISSIGKNNLNSRVSR